MRRRLWLYPPGTEPATPPPGFEAMDTRTALDLVALLRPGDVTLDGDAQAVAVVAEGVGVWWRKRRREGR